MSEYCENTTPQVEVLPFKVLSENPCHYHYIIYDVFGLISLVH